MPKDQFFKNDEGVLGIYDINYDDAFKFEFDLGKNQTMGIMAMIPYCWPFLPCAFCFVNSEMFRSNVDDQIRAQHVAITQDGIKYVTEGHKTGCRLDCQDKGKISKTVPFDKITDCDIEEPAGSSGPCCCMVKNTLTLVNIDTASGSRGGGEPGQGAGHELTIKGLIDPHQFKKDVWSMKRGEGIASSSGASPVGASMEMDRSGGVQMMSAPEPVKTGFFSSKSAAPASNSELTGLMVEQNGLLKEQNGILNKILAKK
ncbi:hypothetical protein TL16_g09932 [Triparma laevis f. inornata]|uniref:Uncharacterized protein n=1 Tax=Triparma laevis f. inornata TaxID=1714386 RepID=A0A9W7B5G5_9STRA|nr:hypothetical protein TL16_g09932 [Triparma laevis f. inornata]